MLPQPRLLSPRVQEAYYAKIAERYLAFCTGAGDSHELQKQFAQLAPIANPTSSLAKGNLSPTYKSDLPQILSALRKLREGLVASSRRDTFAAQVYLFAIRLGILASSYETYYPALLYLLRTLLRPPTSSMTTPNTFGSNNSSNNSSSSSSSSSSTTPTLPLLTPVELHEAQSYLILDAACRRADLAEAYALRRRFGYADAKVDAALRALAHDNWAAWRRVKRAVDGHRARIMEFAEREVRARTLRALGRAYISVELGFLERAVGTGWEEMRDRFGVGWELEDGGGGGGDVIDARVVIRRVKGR